jgi:hypothetical protein
MKKALLFCALVSASACATHDNRDRYVLGGANAANVAHQSMRDVSELNTKPVEDTSGARAAKAVKALEDRKPGDIQPVDFKGTQK